VAKVADLLELALRALDDPDAAVVLGDAVLASGWKDHRISGFFTESVDERGWKTRTSFPMLFGTDSFADAMSGPGAPSTAWARAVAAVLLFDGWPTTWPLALENARNRRTDSRP